MKAVKNPRAKKKYHLRIPSQTENLEIIREFVTGIARKVGFPEDDASKIEIAVDEACTNVIEHAYNKDERKLIDIVIQIDPQKFTITITDQGKGFDPDKVKTPDMKKYLEEMRVGGLGIFLMQTLMDEIDFDVVGGRKNQVKMVKYF
ncbi:ATP-binding protein [candidate division KSB1 bacterium]|nr:ATP-binding protein [candidate division KSB1 bacterium]